MNTNPRLSKMQSSERLPSYEETTKVSKALMNEFISELEREQRSRDSFLIVLLNRRLGIDDKCKAVEGAHRISAIEQDTDAESVEDWLRLRGMHKLAQSVCYYVHTRHSSSDRHWCKALIEADIEIRWIFQRMIWVHQQKRNTVPGTFDENLKSLKRKYWRVHRRLWIADDSISSRFAARGFAFQRQNIDWYLSSELREDCAREEVAVGGRADVAQYHERSMGFEQKGCVTEVTALQHALVVWMPTSLMA